MPKLTGRKGKKTVSPAEHIAIQTMTNAGTSVTAMAKALNRSRQTVTNAVKEAKDLLVGNAKWYAEQHLKATGVAAAKGDSRPAEFMLERIKVVDSPKSNQDNGFTVQIGIMLPGLVTAAPVVEASGNDGEVLDAQEDTTR